MSAGLGIGARGEYARGEIPASSGSVVFEGAVVFAVNKTNVFNSEASFNGSVQAGCVKTTQQSGNAIMQNSVSFNLTKTKAASESVSLEGSLLLAAMHGETQNSNLNASSSVTMIRNLQYEDSGSSFMRDSLTLGIANSVVLESTNSIFEGSINLLVSDGILQSSAIQTGIIDSSVLFGTNVSIASNANGLLESALTIAVNKGLQFTSYNDIVSSLALAMTASIYQYAKISIDGDIAFSINDTLAQTASAVLDGNVPLNSVLAINIVSDAVLLAGFDLSAIKSLSVEAAKIVIGIEVAPNRIFTIEVENRIVDINEDDRVNKIMN